MAFSHKRRTKNSWVKCCGTLSQALCWKPLCSDCAEVGRSQRVTNVVQCVVLVSDRKDTRQHDAGWSNQKPELCVERQVPKSLRHWWPLQLYQGSHWKWTPCFCCSIGFSEHSLIAPSCCCLTKMAVNTQVYFECANQKVCPVTFQVFFLMDLLFPNVFFGPFPHG